MAKHARLSASAAHRWMTCPASVKLSEGITEVESPYASLGTMAHSIVAYCLKNDLQAKDVVDEHAESMQLYLDYCRTYPRVPHGGFKFVELGLAIPLRRVDPDQGGTADFVRYLPDERLLIVVDFKFGTGVPVAAEDNIQLKIYALGAAMRLNSMGEYPARIRVAIVQPRLADPAARIHEHEFEATELVDLAAQLRKAGAATRVLHPAVIPGPEQCRWCPAGKGGACDRRVGYRPNRPAAGPRAKAGDFPNI